VFLFVATKLHFLQKSVKYFYPDRCGFYVFLFVATKLQKVKHLSSFAADCMILRKLLELKRVF